MRDGIAKNDILNFLERAAQAIAQMFGPDCETLIHDMSRPGHPIISIYNGHVSGRKVGETTDIFGDDYYSRVGEYHFKPEQDMINTLAITKRGHKIKSTTINCTGIDYHYAFGINYDYTHLAGVMPALEALTTVGQGLEEALAESSRAPLEEVFSECLALVGKPISAMKKADRLQLIALLVERNGFTYQKSIAFVAEKLGVSRYTVYKYCHELEGK